MSCTVLEYSVTTDEKSVFHNTPENKSESMEWERPRSQRSKNLQFVTSVGKCLPTVCLDHKCVLEADVVQQGTTVNLVSYYVTLWLLRTAIIRKRPGLFAKSVLILHDNNRSHSATTTRLLLQPFRLQILEHPAYSAVLAPSV